MKTYLSLIGRNSTSVTRPLLSRGLDTNDEVILLRPCEEADDSRGAKVLTEVERFLSEIGPEIAIEIERIPHDDFPMAVLNCSDIIRAAEGTVIANLSSGARDIFLPFTVAVLTHTPQIDIVLTYSDIDERVHECPVPVLTANPPASTRETLVLIGHADGGMSIPALTERTGHAKSSISRHVTQLAENGAVVTWKEGKTKYARPTLTGRLLLRAALS